MATRTDEQKAAQAAKRRRKEALAAEAEYERNQAKRREWEANGTRLSREELEAGVPCRGCGLPIIDGLGDRPPLLKLTEAERAEFDTADADYLARHRSCHSHRWSMSGSRTQHCGTAVPRPHSAATRSSRSAGLCHRPLNEVPVNWRLGGSR
jgi:hypothetical protein